MCTLFKASVSLLFCRDFPWIPVLFIFPDFLLSLVEFHTIREKKLKINLPCYWTLSNTVPITLWWCWCVHIWTPGYCYTMACNIVLKQQNHTHTRTLPEHYLPAKTRESMWLFLILSPEQKSLKDLHNAKIESRPVMCNQRSTDMIPLSFHLLKHSVDTRSPAGANSWPCSRIWFSYLLDCQQNKIRSQRCRYGAHFIREKKLLQLHPHFHRLAAEHKHVSM